MVREEQGGELGLDEAEADGGADGQGGVIDLKSLQDVGAVGGGGFEGDAGAGGDFPGSEAVGEEVEDLEFAPGEVGRS